MSSNFDTYKGKDFCSEGGRTDFIEDYVEEFKYILKRMLNESPQFKYKFFSKVFGKDIHNTYLVKIKDKATEIYTYKAGLLLKEKNIWDVQVDLKNPNKNKNTLILSSMINGIRTEIRARFRSKGYKPLPHLGLCFSFSMRRIHFEDIFCKIEDSFDVIQKNISDNIFLSKENYIKFLLDNGLTLIQMHDMMLISKNIYKGSFFEKEWFDLKTRIEEHGYRGEYFQRLKKLPFCYFKDIIKYNYKIPRISEYKFVLKAYILDNLGEGKDKKLDKMKNYFNIRCEFVNVSYDDLSRTYNKELMERQFIRYCNLS